MSEGRKKLAIVMPAFNEQTVIGSVLADLQLKLKGSKTSFDTLIIVVNDGSSDNTSNEVRKYSGVKLIEHLINSGAGAATRTGLHYASEMGYDIAVIMDSDGQHSPDDALKLAQAVAAGKADLIIGNRFGGSGNMPWLKKFGNFGLRLITFLLLGVYATDTQSGLRAFNRKAMETIDFHSNDYAFCSEMIWRAHHAGLKIKEIPIQAIYTEYSLGEGRGQKNISGALNITRQLAKRRFLKLING